MKRILTRHYWPLLAIPFLLTNCKDETSNIPTTCTGIEWTHHEPGNGQQDWTYLCHANSACSGAAQSPVNISGAVTNNLLDSLGFHYSTTPVDIENNGHTIEFVCETGNTLSIGPKKYTLQQFHYHAQSEHQLNGAHFPLEVHFVHKATDTDYAVIGMFFEEGAENELLAKYLQHFPLSKDGHYKSPEEIELTQLLPGNKSFYHYEGSLTTPPCSEVVHWYVLKNKVTASAAQLAQFRAILNDNYRQVQSLNGRPVYSRDQ